MALTYSAAKSKPDGLAASSTGATLLSYPMSLDEPMVVTSDAPAVKAQRMAWIVRERNLDEFLDAKYGANIEDFWTPEYIAYHGREYCEHLLQYIIMFNQEEVGGHAIMYIDQIMMWEPSYFTYAMKYRDNVDELFEPDQIEHYGRKFLEKVIEWCRSAYAANRDYWDKHLSEPLTGRELEDFYATVEKQHKPSKLKEMFIVPKGRENDWPCNYFARARGKTPLPQLQVEKEEAQREANGIANNCAEGSLDDAVDTEPTQQSNDQSGSGPTASSTGGDESNGAFMAPIGDQTGDGGKNDDDDKDKKRAPHGPPLLKSPKSKKAASNGKEDNRMPVLDSTHRRVQSEPESPSKSTITSRPKVTSLSCTCHQDAGTCSSEACNLPSTRPPQTCIIADQSAGKEPNMKAKNDWMSAPGVERRAVSTEQQSKLLEKAAQKPNVGSKQIPSTGRGGAVSGIGRHLYSQGGPIPQLPHPYRHDLVQQNNAAYMYHQDHNFGRERIPRADHVTTYRPGSNIYIADPSRRDMYAPNPQPQPHFSHYAVGGVGYYQGQGAPHLNGAMYAGQSPQIPHPGQAQAAYQSPHVVQTAPHGPVPNHIMQPYLQLANDGHWPTSMPLSQSNQPVNPGMPQMQYPPHAIMRPPHQQGFMQGQQQNVASPTPRHIMEQQLNAVRMGSAPNMTPGNTRREMVRSEPIPFSPYANKFEPGAVRPPPPQGKFTSRGPPSGPANMSRPHRPSVGPNNGTRRGPSGSVDSLPFPSYRDEMLDPIGLPEGAQCESRHIGPDAEDVVTLWIANIPRDTTTEQLRAAIETKMPVAEVREITFDAKANYNLGWTFVKFLSNSDARIALDHFHEHEFRGSRLKVQVPERRTNAAAMRMIRERGTASDQAEPFIGHRTSFSGGGTPGRGSAFNFTASPNARRSRGNSLSQTIHAVRRNSTFSKQDARSDLPLGNLPEVIESSKPATPEPFGSQSEITESEQPKMTEDEHVQAVKKPSKNKKKKKKPNKSRDASAAPSESNISSAVDASAASHDSASTASKPSSVVAIPLKLATYASVAVANSQPADPAEQLAEGKTAIVEADPVPEEVLPTKGEADDDVAKTAAAIDSKDGATEVATAIEESKGHPESAEARTDWADEEVVEAVPSPDTVPAQPHPEIDETEAGSSIAGMSEGPSEATSATVDQPEIPLPKPAKTKTKGPAQLESLSSFAMAKKKEKEEKAKAKKIRKNERKVSKNSGPTNGAAKRRDSRATPAEGGLIQAHAPSAATATTATAPTNAAKPHETTDTKSKELEPKASESSSMAGTPETAREYPASIPNTPTPKAATTAGSFWQMLIYWFLF